MVTFTAAMLQTRQTAVVVHLLSNFFHLLRLLACFLDCLLAASRRRCRLPVPISLRPFTTFMRLYHDLFNLECRRLLLLRVLYRSTGVNFTVDATTSLRA
jgi:hypothetical protein